MNYQDLPSSVPQSRANADKGVAEAFELFEAWSFYGAWMLELGAL